MKFSRNVFLFLVTLFFLPANHADAASAIFSPPTKGHSFHFKIEKRQGEKLKKGKLQCAFSKVKSWLGKGNQRKGVKFGLIGLCFGLGSFILLFLFGSFSIVIGILTAMVAWVFSILNLIKSFKEKERLWPVILSIIVLIPIIFLSLYFIACHDGCF